MAPNDLNCWFWPKMDHFWAIFETQPVVQNVKKYVLITWVSPQSLLKPLKLVFTSKTDVAQISLHCPIWHTVYKQYQFILIYTKDRSINKRFALFTWSSLFLFLFSYLFLGGTSLLLMVAQLWACTISFFFFSFRFSLYGATSSKGDIIRGDVHSFWEITEVLLL